MQRTSRTSRTLPNQSKPLNISVDGELMPKTRRFSLTNGLTSALGLDENNSSVAFRPAIDVHPNVSANDVSGLAHEVFEILPRGLQRKL